MPRRRRARLLAALAAPALLAAACTAGSSDTGPVEADRVTRVDRGEVRDFPPAPDVPEGPLEPAAVTVLDEVFDSMAAVPDPVAIGELGATGDARIAWLLSDLLRFLPSDPARTAVIGSFEELTGTDVPDDDVDAWTQVTDRLIAWDLPAPPGYVDLKRRLFELVEPGWAPFFDDRDSAIDWRLVSWGGVLIDDRPLDEVDEPCPRGCIPALDDPAVTDAAGGDWYDDDELVFGVVVGDEARAYPRNVMEVHEMVNDTLGGRRIAVPYCTLCGSAQAYLTDEVPAGLSPPGGTFELRTSGLLSRSNKVMFELHTMSVLDTFTGEALSGPLQDADVVLPQVTVVTSTWGAWKQTHPDTTIVARDGGIGREYPEDPLGGRDDDGPIFPIGDVDPRLPVQEQVVGVMAPDGEAVAFPAAAARAVLERGGPVELDGVRLETAAGGLRAVGPDGSELTSHQAFWFAWSQFHPDTTLWKPTAGP